MKHSIRVVVIFLILTGTSWMIPRHYSTAAFAGEGEINWKTTWDEAAAASAEPSRPVLILFTDPNRCPPCRMLEANTFPNAEVIAFINDKFVPLLINTGARKNRAFAMQFNFDGIPTFIIVDSKKTEIARIVGYRPPEQLIESLKSAAKTGATEKPASKKIEKKQTGNTVIYVIIILIVLLGVIYFVLKSRQTRNNGK